MTHVSIPMLCRHARKHRVTLYRALKQAGVAVEKSPGLRGGRVSLKAANKFLMRQWPEVGPMLAEVRP